jgi:peptidoglycan/LPS O-acetylase OafA/YrhL
LNKINRAGIKWSLFVILLFSLWLDAYKFISPLVLPFLIIASGLSFSKILTYVPHKLGDISYGVYIYGFLVQQTLLNYLSLDPFLLTILSLSVTYVLSYLSWHYIEKMSGIQKPYLRRQEKYSATCVNVPGKSRHRKPYSPATRNLLATIRVLRTKCDR